MYRGEQLEFCKRVSVEIEIAFSKRLGITFLTLFCRQFVPREGEIQSDMRRPGQHVRRAHGILTIQNPIVMHTNPTIFFFQYHFFSFQNKISKKINQKAPSKPRRPPPTPQEPRGHTPKSLYYFLAFIWQRLLSCFLRKKT